MAAFERVKSGIPEMDEAIDNIRLGDNVVFRLSELSQFKMFVDPYVRQAIEDRRNLIYIRFATHEPLVDKQPGVRIINVELSHRFETFSVTIHNIIEREGKDAFYVFDCLSELQTAWSSDLMMGNFFRVTCPFLFLLDTVAFFPLIRGMHSFQAIERIQNTTQLFFDVFDGGDITYVRPVKVWERSSDTMFLPHIFRQETGKFYPILDGVQSSRYYKLQNRSQRLPDQKDRDSWDRFFDKTVLEREEGVDVSAACDTICDIMMTRDERLRVMVKANFEPEDYFDVRDRMIGTGMVGGKACGMLLARKILENRAPDIADRLEPHDSFYVGSDVFYTYIVENHFWELRVRQRREEEYFSLAERFAEKLKKGRFTRNMESRFVRILEYYGRDPYIVRSSSILEDGFKNAFAGKYESVFCSNVGTVEERLEELEDAIRTVYASTMSMSALKYRKQRGLENRDEQMALLIQRVSGSHYGEYFFPCAAGVGYSYSPYLFLKELDPRAGMLRLVMGLGTAAVDRTEGSYPRLVNLDEPGRTAAKTIGDKHRFSQRNVDVINKTTHMDGQIPFETLLPLMPVYLRNALLEHDTEAERSFRDRGEWRDIQFLSCEGLVRREDLMGDLKNLMQTIQSEYNYPVDIEFTINLSEDGQYRINLLQCRPLKTLKESGIKFDLSDIADEDKLLECIGASMGMSRHEHIDAIVYIDPVKYYEMPYQEKSNISRCIGEANRYYNELGKNTILFSPGRIGTSSPELGVPTTFADISGFKMICEIAESKVGYNPELSYGSHFFQDLVEAEILYTAVFENEKTVAFKPEKLTSNKNLLSIIAPQLKEYEDIVRVCDVSETGAKLYHSMQDERVIVVLE